MSAATAQEVREWVTRAKTKKNVTHVLIVCDHFDYEDYPVEVKEEQDIREVIAKYSGVNMQSIMELYSMKLDIEKQLREHRSWHPNHSWEDKR